MSEMIIEVDENNQVLGLRSREDFYEGKIIHRSSHLMLFNSKGEFATVKRSASKRWYPNLYTFSVSGTVGDETNEECMKREMLEEIGIETPFKELFVFRHSDEQDSAFATLYFAVSDKELKPDEQEVSMVAWVTLSWLREDLIDYPEKYTPAFKEGMKIYFEKYGTEIP